MYDYHRTLTTPFPAAAGVKYWIKIEAVKSTFPDWGLSNGAGGNNSYFQYLTGRATFLFLTGNPSFALLSSSAGTTYTTITSADPVAGGLTTGDGVYASGATVVVAATANSGYGFVNWSENGTPVSSASTYTYTASADRTLVANFGVRYNVTTTPSPIAGGATQGDGSFTAGTDATVYAYPSTGYHFVNWTESSAPVSSAAIYTFTVTGNRNLIGNFALNTYAITTSASPAAGGSTSGDGAFIYATSTIVTATPNAGYTFVNWTENGQLMSALSHYSFVVVKDRNLVANFASPAPTHTITVTASPANGGSVTGGGTYNTNAQATVTATANAGFTFANWTEGANVVSSSPSYSFAVNADRTLVANFTAAPVTHTIALTASPANLGYTTGAGTYNLNATATVTATAYPGSAFVNWTEGANVVSTALVYSFTVTADRTLTANFAPIYTITTLASPANGGITIGAGDYVSGTLVNLTATPTPGFGFVSWTEGGITVTTSANYSFRATAHRNLVANFSQGALYSVSTTASPVTGGTLSGAGIYSGGTLVTVTATANTGFTFVNWSENNSQVSASAVYTFVATANRDLVAHFTAGITRTVSTSSSPVAGGSTTGAGIYPDGDTVTVRATPSVDWGFVNWTEHSVQVSATADYTFTATADRTLVANFVDLHHYGYLPTILSAK